ncbi:MAG: thiamine pyrophosphate-binding protein, partial [Nitrososphaeria archaeon]
MKVKEAIVNILKMERINFVTCFPPNKLINSCAANGIRTILVRQERVAINIADGFARVSFKPGVALVAGGVGIENAFSGISQAYSDMVPILVFVDQSSTDRIGTRPIQDFDALFTLHKVTKWVERINSVKQTEEFMRRAFTYLRSGKTGPVVLELPEDIAEEDLGAELSYKPVKGWKCAGDPEDIRTVVKALSSSRNPLLYVGEGAFYAQAWAEVKEFAELLRLPVMTTLKAKSIFPEDHPLSVGVGGRVGSKVAAYFLKKADLILAVGASLTRGLATSVIGAPMPKGKIIVQSTIDEWDINKDYCADYVIVGDAKLILRQLIEEVKRQNVKLPEREGLEDE